MLGGGDVLIYLRQTDRKRDILIEVMRLMMMMMMMMMMVMMGMLHV